MYLPLDTSKSIDYQLNRYPHKYEDDTYTVYHITKHIQILYYQHSSISIYISTHKR